MVGNGRDKRGGRGWEGSPDTHFGLYVTGEVKKGKVTGFHNWIRFYLQEKEGLLDYYSHNYDGPVSPWAGGTLALPLAAKQSDLLLTRPPQPPNRNHVLLC